MSDEETDLDVDAAEMKPRMEQVMTSLAANALAQKRRSRLQLYLDKVLPWRQYRPWIDLFEHAMNLWEDPDAFEEAGHVDGWKEGHEYLWAFEFGVLFGIDYEQAYPEDRNDDWPIPIEERPSKADDQEVRTDGGQDEPPLLHDDFKRCDECDEIVLIHGRGECLELDDAIYCPRHARPHMADKDWWLRWGKAIELLDAIREDPTKAIKYELRGVPGSFWVVHEEGQRYEVWRHCEDDDDDRNCTIHSERSLVRNIERRASFSAYVGDPPHLVSAAHAPINADVPVDGEVVNLAY